MIDLGEAAVGFNIFQAVDVIVIEEEARVVDVPGGWINLLEVLPGEIQHLLPI